MEWPAGLKARPLGAWPYPVTRRRGRSQFSATLSATSATLAVELRHLQARDTILRLDVDESEIRLDGAPYARAAPSTPAIIVQFDTPTGPLAFPCDRFVSWQENLRAVALSLEALRRVDRYGVTMRAEQYAGFRALEAAPGDAFASRADARGYLAGVGGMQNSSPHTDEVLGRYAMRTAHPDTGGDADVFDRVQAAIDYLKRNPTP